eukprot:10071966-Ditylum_brightwellii.AAC.1
MFSSKESDGGSSLSYYGACQSIFDDESSNDGSKPNIKDCAFADDDTKYVEDMTKVENEKAYTFMDEDWE